jgi:hypothetical protein
MPETPVSDVATPLPAPHTELFQAALLIVHTTDSQGPRLTDSADGTSAPGHRPGSRL